jgi:F-type H+-transporting ATPase subunit alpha
MDSLPVDSVREFEAALMEYLKNRKGEILSAIVSTGKLEKATEEALGKAIEEARAAFLKDKAPAAASAKKAEAEPKANVAAPKPPAGGAAAHA